MAGYQKPTRGSDNSLPVPFDYIEQVFQIDNRDVYIPDNSFENRLKNALRISLPANRESWLFRAEPDAPLHQPIPEDVEDISGMFRRLAEIKSGEPPVSASPEVFYTAYYDWAGRMGLALGIKKEIYTRQQASMESIVFALNGFYNQETNELWVHKIVRPNGYYGANNRVSGLWESPWRNDMDELARDMAYAQKLAETIFNRDHLDVSAIWRSFYQIGGHKVPRPWEPK